MSTRRMPAAARQAPARQARRGLGAILAAIALVAVPGCARSGSGSGPAGTPAAPGSAASATSPATPGTPPGQRACTPDYCVPADWNTSLATTPLAAIPPFIEPLNVIISARSTTSLTAIQQALGNWKTVSTVTSVSVAGIHIKCISSEKANVSGTGYVPQTVAWRLGGCLGGNELSLSGTEDHVRLWHQPVPGSRQGAWFVAASIETMCIAPHGTLEPAVNDKVYAILHSSGAYHCVDGGPGSLTSKYPNGYDDGARVFAAAITSAARAKGWAVTQRVITRPVASGASTGEGGVRFSGNVYVLTVTS